MVPTERFELPSCDSASASPLERFSALRFSEIILLAQQPDDKA